MDPPPTPDPDPAATSISTTTTLVEPPSSNPSTHKPTRSRYFPFRCNVYTRDFVAGILSGVFATILGVLGTVFAISSARFSKNSLQLAEWTAKKDYQEYCLDKKTSGQLDQVCQSILAETLPPPPFQGRSLVKRLLSLDAASSISSTHLSTIKNGTLPAHYDSSRNISDWYSILTIFAIWAGLVIIIARRRSDRRERAGCSEEGVEGLTHADRRTNLRKDSSVGDSSAYHCPTNTKEANPFERTPFSTLSPQLRHRKTLQVDSAIETLLVRFADAVASGDLLTTRHILTTGVDLKAKTDDEYQRTALHLAVSYRHERITELLLDYGADIEARDRHDQTPLHKAVLAGNSKITSLLVSRGAFLEATDRDGRNALHLAALFAHEDTVRVLLKEDVEVDAQDGDGMTPLQKAACCGYATIVSLLLLKGASRKGAGKSNQTALQYAASYGRVEVVNILARRSDIEERDALQRTVLHCSAINGCVNCLRILLKRGAYVDVQDQNLQTPLHLAATKGDEATVRMLFDYGADLNILDANQETAYMKAAFLGHESITSLLLEMGAERDLQSPTQTAWAEFTSPDLARATETAEETWPFNPTDHSMPSFFSIPVTNSGFLTQTTLAANPTLQATASIK
ncbi:MAG: hypothetical protein M4579_000034 [Chaenotheca gracillima]|nr:MAG: hypothetical protein M4579_000034 [Chaenotheca gracillima]